MRRKSRGTPKNIFVIVLAFIATVIIGLGVGVGGYYLIQTRFMPQPTPTQGEPGPIEIDDADAAITYFGEWEAVSGLSGENGNALGGTLHKSKVVGQTAMFEFEGQNIAVIYTSLPEGGTLEITVDGVTIASIDQQASTPTWQNQWMSDPLGAGKHTLVLTHANGSAVNVDAVVVGLTPAETPTLTQTLTLTPQPSPSKTPTPSQTATETFTPTTSGTPPTATATVSGTPPTATTGTADLFTNTPTSSQTTTPTKTTTLTNTITPTKSKTPTRTKTPIVYKTSTKVYRTATKTKTSVPYTPVFPKTLTPAPCKLSSGQNDDSSDCFQGHNYKFEDYKINGVWENVSKIKPGGYMNAKFNSTGNTKITVRGVEGSGLGRLYIYIDSMTSYAGYIQEGIDAYGYGGQGWTSDVLDAGEHTILIAPSYNTNCLFRGATVFEYSGPAPTSGPTKTSTPVTPTATATPVTGYAIHVQNTGSYPQDAVVLPVNPALEDRFLNRTTSFTVEFWFRLMETPANAEGKMLIDHHAGSLDGPGFWIQLGNNSTGLPVIGGINLSGSDPSAPAFFTATSTAKINDTDWHHIALVREHETAGHTLCIWLDGAGDGVANCVSQASVDHDLRVGTWPLYTLGSPTDNDSAIYQVNGYLDEFRISDITRYPHGSGAFSVPGGPFAIDNNTVMLYHFNEGSGSSVCGQTQSASSPSQICGWIVKSFTNYGLSRTMFNTGVSAEAAYLSQMWIAGRFAP